MSRALALVALVACGNEPAGPPTPEPEVVSVKVAPEGATIPVGGTVTMVAIVDVRGGASGAVTWSSSENATASVTPEGVVSGHKAGSVAITARSVFDTSKQDAVSLTVRSESNNPATVFIQSINRGGTPFPVDPDAVVGVVDVSLSVNPGDQLLSRIELVVDDRTVASQTFAASSPMLELQHLPPSQALTAPSVVVLSFNTAAYDAATGVPHFLNGPRTISARLVPQPGSAGSSATTTLGFRNSDAIAASVTASGASASDAAGRVWRSGDLTVSLLPIIYSSEGLALASAVVAFPGLSEKQTNGAPVSWPASLPVQNGGSAGYSNNGGLAPQSPVVVSSVLSDGSGGPAGAVINSAAVGIRLDNRGPNPGFLALTDQTATLGCCAGGWVGSGYLFSMGHSPSPGDGEGVDGSGIAAGGITYHVGAPTLSDAQIAALPAVVGGSGLTESELNSAYTVVARVVDRVGNVSLLRLAPSAENALATFGVDRVAPTFTFNALAGLQEGAINPPNPALFETVPSDGRSGYTLTPVVHRIIGNFSNAFCFLGVGTNCTPVIGGFSFPAPVSQGLYYTYEAFLLDRAGNRSPTIARTILVDNTPPSIVNMPLPTSLTGGAATQFTASVADNVDLASAQHRLEFPSFSGASSSLPFAAPVIFDAFGLPLTVFQNVVSTIPFVRSMELVGATDAPLGILEPVLGSRYTVHDRASNSATSLALFPPGGITVGNGAQAQLGVQQFRITAPAASIPVCGTTACAGGVPQTRLVTVEAAGQTGSFANPFGNGVYLFRVDGAGVTRLIGSSSTPSVDDSDGIARRWRWSINFNATGLNEQLAVPVFAIGVSGGTSPGDGLRTRIITHISIVH